MAQKKKTILNVNGHRVEAYGKMGKFQNIYVLYEDRYGNVDEWVRCDGFSSWEVVENWLTRFEIKNDITVIEVAGV